MTVRELTAEFNAGVQTGDGDVVITVPGQEAISESWVDAAMTVWERIISKDAHRALVLKMDDLHGTRSPYNSVHKLNEI
eukprot:3527957-Pyramimonas_sp.AAC.1